MELTNLKTSAAKGAIILPVVCLLILSVPVLSQTGGQYDLSWNTIDGGGGVSSGGQYVLTGTIGQPDAAYSTGGSYKLFGGFWGIGCFPWWQHPDYANWIDVGKPGCWCYPRQCHGDADGKTPQTEAPFYWVTEDDLSILKSGWMKTVEQLSGNAICADFNRRPESTKAPFYRVGLHDLDILKRNWRIPNGPDPNCSPGNKNP